jgi:beta-lactamase regulating signal transducer with metallopeptidase domain
MIEHITRALYYLEVHLLYASLLWFVAWLLTAIPHVNATSKYWIWVATTLNFVFPLGALVDRTWGWHLSWATPLGAVGDVAARITQSPGAGAFGVVWLLGATLMFARLCLRISAERGRVQPLAGRHSGDAKWAFGTQRVQVKIAESWQAPAVDGILRPYISLPRGLDRVLSEHELQAVLIHELTHARRLDNLIRLIHEVGLCVLWFHPLVWITGFKLALYRELSCDEFVIQSAHGKDLVSALAKLANPERTLLLQARASSFLSHRLACLNATPSESTYRTANWLVALLFAAALVAGVLATVAHTACCWVART